MRRSNGRDFPDAKILVIDDEEVNLKLARQVLLIAGYSDIRILQDPRQAVDAIMRDEPDLVLLDVHMPHMDGYEVLDKVLKRVKQDSFIPILMCTSDNSPEARKRALELGANDFIAKPYEQTELLLRVRNFLRMRYLHLSLQEANATLEHRVKVRTQELVEARGEAFYCLGRALEFREDTIGGHAKRVGNWSEQVARALGLEDAEVEMVGLIAPLHDLGKIGIPDVLLLKPGEYTDEERAEMQRHTLLGETIIGECRSPILKELRDLALHHHERWDGTGYPHGLKGDEIPITCRIVAVADMFDALTSGRIYKPAWTHELAIAEIRRLKGTHFDPAVVDAFLRTFGAG
jgi:putative two-component system response regulator